MNTQKEQWEEEFDELYPDKLEQTRSHDGTDTGVVVKFDVRGQLKDFIHKTLASQRETLAVEIEEKRQFARAQHQQIYTDIVAHIRKQL